MRFMFLLIACFGSLAVSAQKSFGVYDLMNSKFVTEVQISPDGDKVAYTVMRRRPLSEGAGANYTDLYVLDIKSGDSKCYISENKSLSGIAWRPKHAQITFLASWSGSNQVYGIDLDGGSYQQLTHSANSMGSYQWHPGGKSLAYIGYERSSGKNEHYQLGFNAEVFEEDLTKKNLYWWNMEKGTSTLLNDQMAIHTIAWDPVGERIAFMASPENLVDQYYMDKRVYTYSMSSKEVTKVIDNPGKLTDMAWSPDGKHIAIVSAADKNDPVSGSVFVQNLDEIKPFSKLKNYVGGLELSATHVKWLDKKTIIFSADESVETTLSTYEIDAEAREVVLEAGKVILSNFSVVNGLVAFGGNTPQHPNELFTFGIKKKSLQKHTDVNAHLADFKLAKQEKVSYKARDGKTIEGVLIYPLNYQNGQKYALINYIHGGPESCVKNGWSTYYSMWGQVAAARDYFVFMPNYRGSSGRGIAYSKADYGDLADEEFNDVLDGIDYLVANKGVDRSRVGIGGGSYGGYFSAWAATRHSEHFKASCVFVGVSNQVSKRNTTDIPNEDYLVHWGIWTNENIELIYDRSPVKYASNNKTPTLILHGKEDPRVHPSQSLELYRQLKMHGDAAVRLVWYPGEGHGNRMNPARIDYCLRTMEWFDYYLQAGKDRHSLPDKNLEIELK